MNNNPHPEPIFQDKAGLDAVIDPVLDYDRETHSVSTASVEPLPVYRERIGVRC